MSALAHNPSTWKPETGKLWVPNSSWATQQEPNFKNQSKTNQPNKRTLIPSALDTYPKTCMVAGSCHGSAMNFLRKLHTLFFIMTLPKPHTRVLFFLHPYQHLLYFNYLVTVTLVSVGVFSFGFMCIVLDIKGKRLFINLLANCTNISEKWLFKSLAHF